MLQLDMYNKEYEEMLEKAIGDLQENTPINDLSPGAISRALLEVYYDDMDEFYDTLTNSMSMRFLSSASGKYLDEIAKIFNMERNDGESDQNFRYRIIHATESYAKANKQAVRQAILSVDPIRDVEFKRFMRGTGSFDVYIAADRAEAQLSESVIEEAQEAIEEDEAFGIDGQILEADPIVFDIEIHLTFEEEATNNDKSNISDIVKQTVIEYINNLYFEDEFVITELVNIIMGVDDYIRDIDIVKLFIDGEQYPVRNHLIDWDEQGVAGDIAVIYRT